MEAEVQGQYGQSRESLFQKQRRRKERRQKRKKNNWKSVQVIPDSTLSDLLPSPGNTQHSPTPLCTLSYLQSAQVWMPPAIPSPITPAACSEWERKTGQADTLTPAAPPTLLRLLRTGRWSLNN